MKHDLHDFSFSQKNHDFYLNFFKYIKTQNFNVDDVTERPRGTLYKTLCYTISKGNLSSTISIIHKTILIISYNHVGKNLIYLNMTTIVISIILV